MPSFFYGGYAQFLTAGGHVAAELPCSGQREVMLSPTQTPFVLRAYTKASPPPRVIRGGEVIQLHHKELEAYLAAEGACGTDLPTIDAHMRERLPDVERPHRLLPPTSAVTLWQARPFPPLPRVPFVLARLTLCLMPQVEHEDPTDGSPVAWTDRIRLKHVGTQQYLTLARNEAARVVGAATHDGNADHAFKAKAYQDVTLRRTALMGEIKLTPDITDVDTVFRMHPVVREGAYVTRKSYCRIEHAASAHWLHAGSGASKDGGKDGGKSAGARAPIRQPDTADQTSELAKRMGAIKWDNAALLPVTVLAESMFDDAFIVQDVAESHVRVVFLFFFY